MLILQTNSQELAMWAAIIGAASGFVTAIVSFFAIRYSRQNTLEQIKKDFEIAKLNFNANVISVNRQNWINELRATVSDFLGVGTYLVAVNHSLESELYDRIGELI